MAKTRSAKGEIVDFDLLKIRQKLQQKPASVDVKAREDFIDKKIRRRNRKIKQAAASGPVDSNDLLNVESSEPRKLIDQKDTETQPTTDESEHKQVDKKTKQKHRPPVR